VFRGSSSSIHGVHKFQPNYKVFRESSSPIGIDGSDEHTVAADLTNLEDRFYLSIEHQVDVEEVILRTCGKGYQKEVKAVR
jgi:hypothetical protein